MIDFTKVQEILREKQEVLIKFEEATQQMLSCPAEQLEEYVSMRQKMLDRAIALEEELGALCRESPDGESVMAASKGSCDAEEVSESEGLSAVYDTAMQIRTVLSRLKESDVQAALRLRSEQEMILRQIKATNQGVGAKAARFYSPAFGTDRGPSRLGNA